MTDFKIALAGKSISVRALYPSTLDFCKDYLTDLPPDVSVFVTEEDILSEREKSAKERELEGLPPYEFPAPYLETLALYRKIADELISYDTILFHGSALMMDGEAYIFTARSGTGKSTHTALWRKVYGDRVTVINDDKPLLHIGEDKVTVFGTPWCGKHRLGENISAPLSAVCVLTRAKENSIKPISRTDALVQLLSQTYRVRSGEGMTKLLSLLDRLLSLSGAYLLGCNMDDSAAEVSYNGMKGNNMKLKSTFITHKSGDEQLMISADGGFSGMVRSNSTAADIIDLLKNDTTKEDMILAMLDKYDATRAEIERDVEKVLTALRGIGAIDE